MTPEEQRLREMNTELLVALKTLVALMADLCGKNLYALPYARIAALEVIAKAEAAE